MRSIYVLFAAAFVIAGCGRDDANQGGTDTGATPPADTSTMPSTTTEPSPTPPADTTGTGTGTTGDTTAPTTTDAPSQTPPAQ